MTHRAISFACSVLLFALLAACGDPTPSKYPTQPVAVEASALGPGDKIKVRIEFGAGEDEKIEREFTIDASGEIAVPYIDIVTVTDRSPAEIREEIKKRLADGYLKNPIVWVDVLEIKSKNVSVMGEIKTPNIYPYRAGMTILDAISLAGGFTPMSRKNAVTVVRTQPDGERTKYTVPVGDIQNNQADDFPMQPGDVINVPERLF